MNRKSLKILVLIGFLLSLAAACGKVDRVKGNYIACSREIIEISKTFDPKSVSYLERLKQKVLGIGKKHNFQDIPQLKAAYKKYIKDSDPRLLEILQKIEVTRPGKISKEIPLDTVQGIDQVLEEQDKKKAEDEKSFLIGCERGDKGRVLYFLDKGVDVNAREEKTGKTGLHYAVEGFHTEIVKILLEKGADVNARDEKTGKTGLYYAVGNFNTEIVKILLEKGADANIRTVDGLTPILLTGAGIQVLQSIDVLRHTEIIDLLLNAGANVNDQTEAGGLNILGMYLLYSPVNDTLRIAQYLLEKGADINAKTTSDLECYSLFFPAGSTLLDIMTATNNQVAINFLKKNGARHGTWAKYYLEGKAKEDFLKSQEVQVPVKQAEPGPGADRSKAETKKDLKSPSEVVIAAYMAANKGNYAEAEKYIHSGFLASIPEADRTQTLKKRWDKLTQGKKVEKIEIVGQDIQEEGATVYIKIHFKDGNKKVVKTQLIKEDGYWKIAALE
jgi:ankyrin repeat protein